MTDETDWLPIASTVAQTAENGQTVRRAPADPNNRVVGHLRAKYHGLRFDSYRSFKEIDTVVWHWTGGTGDARSTARYFHLLKERRKDGTARQASAHFTLGRVGEIWQCVPLTHVAWHAGGGWFRNAAALNFRSIGVEVCNQGWVTDREIGRYTPDELYQGRHRNTRDRHTRWERYRPHQEESIQWLAHELKRLIPTIKYHTGHEDVMNLQMGQKGVKLDPGPAFPWTRVCWPSGTAIVRYDYKANTWVEEQ